MNQASSASASSTFIRYGIPGVVLLAGLGLSLYARAAPHGPELGLMPAALALWLLPGVSVLVFVGVRLSSGATDRNSDLLLSWVASFPSMLHVLHLLFAIGIMQRLDRGVAGLAALLDLGLAALVIQLPLGSPYGLRLEATLRSESTWRRSHQRLGQGFVAAALLAATTVWLPPKGDLWALLGGPCLAVVLGLQEALRRPLEDPEAPGRPTPGTDDPKEDESSP